MLKWLGILLGALTSVVRCRRDLALENLALRQQLAVLKRAHPRPRLTRGDRFFWVLASKLCSGWRHALPVVQPDTVIRWHRQGFRYYWRWKSRRRRRPSLDPETIQLIRRMCRANPLWGAPRIHGELLEACGPDETPRYRVRDRGAIYGEWFRRQARTLGITESPTAPQSPWKNPYAERVIGSIRRECLDHVILV